MSSNGTSDRWTWPGKKPRNWRMTKQNGVDVWPNAAMWMRDELRSKVRGSMYGSSTTRSEVSWKVFGLVKANSKCAIHRKSNTINASLQLRTDSVLYWFDCIWNNWEPAAHVIAGKRSGYLQFVTHLKYWQATAMAELHFFRHSNWTGKLNTIQWILICSKTGQYSNVVELELCHSASSDDELWSCIAVAE